MKSTILGIAVLVLVSPAVRAEIPEPTMAEQIAELVNVERWDNGQLPPFKLQATLSQCAYVHSQNMGDRNFFAHCDLDENTAPWDRMLAAGYSYYWAGENIAAAYPNAQAVMNGWMNSPGHRANILHANFTEIGVGYYVDGTDASGVRHDSDHDCLHDNTGGPYTRYYTQNFGSRSGIYPMIINREAFSTDSPQVNLYLYGSGWAQDMRFSNDGQDWSAWEPYSSDKSWSLSGASGLKTVYCELKNGVGVVKSVEDDIYLTASVTAVDDPVQSVFAASLARPNPFTNETRIQLSLPAQEAVTVDVFDVSGRLVRTLENRTLAAGSHEVSWNGTDSRGVRIPEGVYFMRVVAGRESRVVKVIHRK